MRETDFKDDAALFAVNCLVVIVSDFQDLVVEDGYELVVERDSCDSESDEFLEVLLTEDWKLGIDLKFECQ